jgi:type IV secretion system protein VirB9
MIPRSLMAGTSLVLALAAAAPAFALDRTTPSQRDQNIRFVVYDPNNVVPLKTTMGTALMVTFSPDEHIVKVAVSDSARLMTDVVKDGNERLANYLFLKPIALKEDPAGYVLPAQPLMVITERKGSLRHYQFLFQAQPAGGDPDYAVFFRYPNDADMQGAGEARERQRRAEAAQTRGLLRRETNLVSSTPGFDGSRNYRYAARGDVQIAPAWVWDTGYTTYFNWPGMQRIPSIFRGACGPGEATSESSTHNDIVIAPGTAPIWCLRDQRSAVEIYNLGHTTFGATPNTGTISPYVERTVTDGR